MYVCIYVCKMSCYWVPHINYAYKPPVQCATRVYKALHTFCGTDMERHRRNATEEHRDRRQQGDGERRMVTRQQETYLCHSQHLVGESQQHAQESEEHRQCIYWYRHHQHLSTGRLACLLRGFAGSDIMKPKAS